MKSRRLLELIFSSSLAFSSSASLLMPVIRISLQAKGSQQSLQAGTGSSPITTTAGLLALLNEAESGCASIQSGLIQLQKDVTVSQSIYINGTDQSSMTLDLNGHTLRIETKESAGIILDNSASQSFVIQDSGTKGMITNAPGSTQSSFALIQSGSGQAAGNASFILNSGTLLSDQIVLSVGNNSQALINGGSLQSTSLSLQALDVSENGSVIMNDGMISTDAQVIKEDPANAHNCAVKLNDSSSFTLKNGTINPAKAHGIYVYGNSTLLVQGGEVSGVCAIRTNGNLTGASAHITIAAGTITGNESNAGIYIPSAQVNISGGTISGGIGIFVRGQNDGTKTGEGYGGGLLVSGGKVKGTALSGADPGTASVNAAFGNGAIVYDYNNIASPPYDAGTGLVTITGGTFQSPSGTEAVKVLNTGQSLWNQSSSPLKIAGGSFSSMVPTDFLNGSLSQLQDQAGGLYSYVSVSSGQDQLENRPGSVLTSYENLQKAQQAGSGLYFSLNLTGGSEAITYTQIPSGSLINLPAASKTGYTFTGYAPAGGAIVSNPYTVTGNTTLIAQFSMQSPEPINPPASGPGIDQPGSQSVPNTGGTTSTTYSRGYNGVTSRIVSDNETNTILSLFANVPSIPQNNSPQHPISIPLGENTLFHKALSLSGNVQQQSAPVLTVDLAKGAQSAWISFAVDNAYYSTTAMISDERGNFSPLARSIIEPEKGEITLQAENGQSLILCNNAKIFADQNSIPGYGKDAAAFLSSRNLMGVDTSGNNFNPAKTINRAQLAVILYRFEGEPDTTSMPLPLDVPANAYYSQAARWAANCKLMAVGSHFNGTKALSREELAAILYRYQKAASSNLSVLNAYPDQNRVSSWARESMAWAVENRLIGVNSDLNPLFSASRINAATILTRYFESVFA